MKLLSVLILLTTLASPSDGAEPTPQDRRQAAHTEIELRLRYSLAQEMIARREAEIRELVREAAEIQVRLGELAKKAKEAKQGEAAKP